MSPHAAFASSNSPGLSQPRRSTTSRRSSAMCAGGPPKPVTPMRSQSRATVPSGAARKLVVRVRRVFELAVDAAGDEGGLFADVDGVVADALDRARDLRHPHGPL